MSRSFTPTPRNSRHGIVAGSLVLFCLGMASFPYVYKTYYLGGRNITHEHRSLPGQAAIRGQYVNSGSKDIGADPDWKDGHWRGRKNVANHQDQHEPTGKSS